MKTKKQYTPEEALHYAAGLCARTEQCEYDIRGKLAGRGLPLSRIEEIINYLYDHGFLDEARYARAFCRDKARFNRWGRIKIRAHLAARRVGRDAIAEGMAAIDEDEYMRTLRSVAASLARGVDTGDYAGRMKLLRRLASRGFEPDLASAVIREMRDGSE